jgi:hypothetical protein
MEAESWEELEFLLKDAGIPTDVAMGLGAGSDDSEGLQKVVLVHQGRPLNLKS